MMFAATELEALVADVFTAAGCSAQEAGRVALHLVKANLAGHDSHGVVRVPRYIQMMREEMIFAGRQAQVVVDAPALAVVDGQFGFGQTVAPRAVEIGIDKCRAMGLSAVALRNAGHVGRVADWAEMAADAGLVSVHFVNAARGGDIAPRRARDSHARRAPAQRGAPAAGNLDPSDRDGPLSRRGGAPLAERCGRTAKLELQEETFA
jgi:uncharacterized oxidoreductase